MNNPEQKSPDGIPNLTDLKPCPFCGGKPYLHEWSFGAAVLCRTCFMRGPDVVAADTRGETARLAMKLWERRTSNAVTERNHKLENALQKIKQILTVAAGNRRFMQIANPARECLNIINQLNK